MKKKGFTLIELLAVIVILAIIAVIATPIILGIVENTRKEAFQRSVELVVKATDLNVNNKIYETNYTYTLTNGVISDDVAVTNTEGMNGTINYDKDGNVTYAIHNDKWCVVKGIETTIKDYEEGKCNLPGTIFTIIYNLNGGMQGENAVDSFTSETDTFSLPTPIKEQNTFLGWYANQDFTGEAVTEIEKGTEGNKMFYAKWEVTKYTLTYNILYKEGTESNQVRLAYGEQYQIAVAESDEYEFYRWQVIGEGSSMEGITFTMGSEDTELNAILKYPYEDGYPVYYDVATGDRCTNYHEDNSITGYNGVYEGDNSTATTENQNSCLKFYAFNYDEGDTVINLLLDHNTTANVRWTNAQTTVNTNGPIDVINQLKTDTSSWIGTEVPSDYTVAQTTGGNYTIDYDNEDDTLDYKARLITVNEIAEITGADTKEGLMFDESTTKYNRWFYFDSLSQAKSETCKIGNTTGCNYGWLYDRIRTECTTYGCLNNVTGSNLDNMYGYWTSTSIFSDASLAWSVHGSGCLSNYYVYNQYNGVRPVIEVLNLTSNP